MNKIRVEVDNKTYWGIGAIYRNGIKVLDFYQFRQLEITPEHIIVWESVGGQDSPFCKGRMLRKIDISKSEYELIEK